MINTKASAVISAVICSLCSVLLAVLVFAMPSFFPWFYGMLHGNAAFAPFVIKTVITAFYLCVPFAGTALFLMLRILSNVLHGKVFIKNNTSCFRYISWCCYAVAVITGVFSFRYFPLCVIAFAMLVVGTLLRVVKNIMQAACEIREENDLTI